uniref:C2H2-type domain-containing protein n=1 Tax=Amphiprion ocellaris TaxID=80972 RepID=A0AAQ5XXS9_AMPOC
PELILIQPSPASTSGGEEVVLDMVSAPAQQPEQSDHPFQCLDCGKSFRWSSRLTHHLRSHNNERPYRCNLCPKAFKGSSALLYHQRSHSGEKPYKCQDCGKAFKRSSLLQVHQSVHTGLRTFLCPFCPLTFKWSSHYQYHLRQHTGECPYPCDTCPKAFKNSSSLRRHKNVHLGLKPYTCSVCNKSFTQSTNLRQHMRIHTGERPYICSECGRSFTHSSNLALHKNSHTNLNAAGKEVVVGAEEVTQEGADGVGVGMEEVFLVLLYSCGSCSHTFSTRTDLEEHQAIHMAPEEHGSRGEAGHGAGMEVGDGLPFNILLSEYSLLLWSLQMHSLSSQSRSQFSCSACDRSFPLLSSLLTHQHSHTPEQRLLAEAEAEIVCPPSLSLSLPLPSSPGRADKQQEERPYRCSECGKAFKGSSGLKYHMRDHTGERPYRCTECGKSFKRSSLLSIHQRVHTGVRAFQCPHCPLTFKWSSHYQYHLRQHTGERPYVCKECGKSFKNTSCLRRHSQMHSGLRPHTCSVCSKSFSQTSNLKQHERTHSGERPFQCTHCSKSFTHSSNLQLHLRTHSSRKDFKCPFCSKEFVMHSYLQRHIRTHGGGVSLQGGGGKDGVSVKASVGGVTTTTTLLNPITLEASGSSGSLIVSQPALNIPPNTSQNYFMIQTASGLQLIPLSAPAPPPPPPPPPSQPQNFLLLQCPANSGGQSSLILVPTAANPPENLPVLQTIQTFQPQITQFPSVQQQQQTRIIITNNNNTHAPVAAATHSYLLNRPILGRSTRTARGRRGRKPKAALQKPANPPVTNGHTAATELLPPPPVSTTTDTSGPPPGVATAPVPESRPHPAAEQTSTEDGVTGKQFVLCFDNEGRAKEGVRMGEAGESYVLQFEGNPAGGEADSGVGGDGKSLVLQFKTDGEAEKGGDKAGVMSLLHQWGEEKAGEGAGAVGEGGRRESYVLHFHTETQGGAVSGGRERSLQLSCSNAQSLVPLDGQEVVFELGGGAKMEPETEEGMQMIALIEGEGGVMAGEEGAGCSDASGGGGGVTEGGAAATASMEGIFQLESGDEIVIIEVSTSSLREGRGERGGEAELPQAEEVKDKSGNQEPDGAQSDDTIRNGPISKEML